MGGGAAGASPGAVPDVDAAGVWGEVGPPEHLYAEAIRRPALENDALRSGAAVLPLPTRSTPAPS
jgi:hypothetical protein